MQSRFDFLQLLQVGWASSHYMGNNWLEIGNIDNRDGGAGGRCRTAVVQFGSDWEVGRNRRGRCGPGDPEF